ncbi:MULTISPECIES: flavodoxin family protein BilS [Anaerostipes]|uniref:Flavodoxin n=1 Tax=Anaerostipes butyraticus TaxID=645466 RepID=A0A916Q6W1_9FIRM|nr:MULTISPECIES: flavodoxin family protein BilS [Anaerostipes]GFO85437.1 flavodoxin [Anaerostipes butyraticus]HJC81672.1 flavodoxin family protein [Candidatus Anaerostipes avicola]
MKYSIVYSSRTGNTKLLAEHLKSSLPDDSVIYFGKPSAEAAEADLIFLGFWTDKGCCDETVTDFLTLLSSKKIFLFGTAGFGQSDAYFEQILSRVREQIPKSCQVTGTFMCQGKMPDSVRKRYEAMMSQEPEKARQLIANFDQALTHPDKEDLAHLNQKIRDFI